MTPRQLQALRYIKKYLVDNDGVSPSYREISAGIGMNSASEARRVVDALERQNFITYIPHTARSIRLVPQKQYCATCGASIVVGE